MSGIHAGVRWDVPTTEALRRLTTELLPLGLRASDAERSFHRDLYFDTPDAALRQRGATCRFRVRSDDRRQLMVALVEDARGQIEYRRVDAEVSTADAREALEGPSEPARILRSLVSPAALDVDVELETERYTRAASGGWLRHRRFELHYDIVTVRAAGLARTFQELRVRERRSGRPSLEQVSRAIRESYGLRAVTPDRHVRGILVRDALESEALARSVGGGRWVAVIALEESRAACLMDGRVARLPVAEGSGEDACRHLMRRVLGSAVGDLHLLSTVLGEGRQRSLEVWIANHVDRSARPAANSTIEWLPLAELLAQAGSSALHDPPTLAALTTLMRSEIFPRLSAQASSESRSGTGIGITAELRAALPTGPASAATPSDVGPLLDGELSLLEFNARVLALAEDETVPLLERVRYLSIVSTNLDEFFMVRVGGLKYDGQEVAAEGDSGASVDERLETISRHARAVVARQYACFGACRRALDEHGIRLCEPGTLDPAQRDHLRSYFRSTVFPYLTPRAITATPGHSLPVIPDMTLSLAVSMRDSRSGGPLHLADLAIPATLPRFVQLPDGNEFVPIEDVIRPELQAIYPGRRIEHAYLFRVTRHADLEVDERRAGNLVQAIEEGAQRRRHEPVVRIEVERTMPTALRELLLRELQLEPGARLGALRQDDIYEIDGLMDLGALRQIAGLPIPELHFPPFQPAPSLDPSGSLWDVLRARDVLLHHPYDGFSTTVERFFEQAADDPDVAAIKVTLYRAGERSPIVDALLRAASAGKDVTVFVELKARFDEQRNVRWARQLEAAGVHVVHGVLGAKNHAKVALVIRREEGTARRYVHVGTGNYNADSARVYTDLGLLTARDELCADINDLFNALTGSSVPSAHTYRECLVAPSGLLPGLLERIDREARHARSGVGGRIRIKLNGLSDREVVQALYRASQAGVEIDLIVRGICTLCPGVPGVSDHIRVISLLGRFLEHARIFHFANGGEPEYFIGSADLRPRNLRRRVEVLAPVRDPDLRARLDRILALELEDPTAWELGADGTYARRSPSRETARISAQVQLMTLAADTQVAPVG